MCPCFRISGEFLTDFYRGLVTENKWVSAMNGLHQSLHGITMDQVVLVLKGDAKLCGENNDISFESDNAIEYKKELEWMYSGIFENSNGSCYKPYAYVKTVGANDAVYARRKLCGIPNDASMFYCERIKFYMENPNDDIMSEVPKQALQFFDNSISVILLGKCNTPPLWIETHRSVDAAIIDFLNNRKLKEIGAMDEDASSLKTNVNIASKTVIHSHDFNDECQSKTHDTDTKEDANSIIDIERQEQEQLEFEKQIQTLRNEIIETANSYIYGEKGWFLLELKDGRSIKIPRPPFEQWAFSKINVKNIAIPWDPISPTGMKMYGDDPFHTDWILGAGLDLNVMTNQYSHPDVYDEAIHEAAWAKRFELVSEKLNFDFLPLCGNKKFNSRCFIPDLKKDDPFDGFFNQEIIVIENLDATHFSLYQKIPDGSCILAGNGGPGSHMVIANKKDICIGIVENIHLIATNHTNISIDFENGTINIDDIPNLEW